jgi:hypothetical protein
MAEKFCLWPNFHVITGFFNMPQIWDRGQTAVLPFRRKACWGFFSPEKFLLLRSGLNLRTRVPEDSMLTTRPSKPLFWREGFGNHVGCQYKNTSFNDSSPRTTASNYLTYMSRRVSWEISMISSLSVVLLDLYKPKQTSVFLRHFLVLQQSYLFLCYRDFKGLLLSSPYSIALQFTPVWPAGCSEYIINI